MSSKEANTRQKKLKLCHQWLKSSKCLHAQIT